MLKGTEDKHCQLVSCLANTSHAALRKKLDFCSAVDIDVDYFVIVFKVLDKTYQLNCELGLLYFFANNFCPPPPPTYTHRQDYSTWYGAGSLLSAQCEHSKVVKYWYWKDTFSECVHLSVCLCMLHW